MYPVKQYLAETLIKLNQQERLEKITVTRLCREANLSKQTFYSHFKDKQDLIAWIFTTDVNNLEPRQGERYSVSDLRQSFDRLLARKAFYQQAFATDKGHSLKAHIIHRVIRQNTQWLEESDPAALEDSRAMYEIAYHAYGSFACVQWWLQDAYPISIEELAALMYESLPPALKRAWADSGENEGAAST